MSDDHRVLLHGSRFDVHQMRLTGSDGKTYLREVIRHEGAVVLLPIINANTIVLIENNRPTVGETLLELPAGTREKGESAIETASRELIEETGYRAAVLTPLHQFYSAPGIGDELMHLFVATQLESGRAAREATEEIANRITTRDEVIEMIETGKIRDAKSLVGLYAFLHSPRVASLL